MTGDALIKSLNAQVATNLSPNNSKPIRDIYHLANQLLTQAETYFAQDDYEFAYVFFQRYAAYFIHAISKHNGFDMKQNAPEKARYRACKFCKIYFEH